MKTFVLDTNVILHDPLAMFAFQGARVVIPLTVIEELDTFKRNNDERGRSARLVARKLDELRKKGKLSDWVDLDHGGKLKVEIQVAEGLPRSFSTHTKDNEILSCAQFFKKTGENVVFISKDINLRIKAEALGLEAQDYEKSKVDIDVLYSGWREMAVETALIDKFYKEKKIIVPGVEFMPNEFAVLRSAAGGSQSALARFDPKAGALVALGKSEAAPWGIKPLNTEQRFAIELLLNKDIQLVTLIGVPGSGKTMLSLAAGLQQTLEEKHFRRILVGRPVVAVGHDIGFLPGTKQEKLTNWMGAIYDNLSFLLERPKGSLETTDMDIQMLIEEGTLEIEAVTYLRGRSLPNLYIIIDDAQNLTPHEVKTIISRAGKGAKIILTGDPYQIDNYYLDASSNGLTYLVERFKGQAIFGHVTFTKSERSPLAALASDLL
ncbi:MAG TPA: phosphate starvation-inducible protein PhoH [Elusimicrobia bacterium]|nr:phosphate starvation-inducible protein PhoH [Elusimicrobiota bacterium]HBT62593.1 phosphate starvation-inducible protein PhoH [Elusimicrobiota bacterium]